MHSHKVYKYVKWLGAHLYSLIQRLLCFNWAQQVSHTKPCLCTVSMDYNMGVSIHWTGLLDWNTGLDYWTDIFLVFAHSYLFI